MLEQPANRILARVLPAGLLGWALSFAVMAQAAAAESLPASVRACAAQTDRERRLDCFDREVARFSDSKLTPPVANSQAAAPPPGAPAASATPAPRATPTPPAAPAPSAAATTSAAPAGSAAPNAGKPGRIVARVVSIDRAPNEMVLHLDNGDVWEEVQSVAGDLSLKAGDNITIDKRLGSYWLTGPHVSGMKVRQRT